MLSRAPRAALSMWINPGTAEPIGQAGPGVRTAASFGVTTMVGRPGAELGILRSAKRSLWPTRMPLKAPKATNTVSTSFPSACVRFSPGGERQQMPTTARPSRVMRRAKPVPKKSTALHTQGPYRLPLRACRNSGPARRHLRRPPGARPRQTAPEGKDAGTGFANLSGK